jgi:putative transposase
MKRKRFTEEQIIGIVKEQALGAKAADLCRKHGISEATFYNRKSRYGYGSVRGQAAKGA